jgi:hypothetical protein
MSRYVSRQQHADYYDLKWDEPFPPLYGKPIEIPANTILWRGYDLSYDPISDRFAYFGPILTARSYGLGPGRSTGCFLTTKALRVLDIRFLNVLLMRLIKANSSSRHFQAFAALMLSFGLCSLGNQIRILKERYAGELRTNTAQSKIIKAGIRELEKYYNPDDIIEQQGFRIAETLNDGYSMTFLKELFRDVIDGFISPPLQSPFHIEKKGVMNPELILFNPIKSGIRQHQTSLKNIRLLTIQELIIRDSNGHISLENKIPNIKLNFFMIGGGMDVTPVFQFGGGKLNNEEFNILLNKNDKSAIEIHKRATRDGRLWREKMVDIYEIVSPGPCIPVSPFPERFHNADV